MANLLDTLSGLFGGAQQQEPDEVQQTPGRPGVDGTVDYGPGMRQLPDDLKTVLLDLIKKYEADTETSRRENVRKILKARSFLMGRQNIWWDDLAGRWKLPAQGGTATIDGTMLDSAYVVNIYQAFALSLFSIITGNNPTQVWWPDRPNNQADILGAQKADVVWKQFEKNNDLPQKVLEGIGYLWTDGTFGSYVRYVEHERFGTHEEPVMESYEKKMGEDAYRCATCGTETPASAFSGTCPGCGAPLGMESLVPAPTAPAQRQAVDPMTLKPQVRVVANGCEVMDQIGGLELILPPTAKEQWQFPYLEWRTEMDRALIRATYPEIAEQVNETTSDNLTVEDRRARIITKLGTTLQNLSVGQEGAKNQVTFRRVWLRSWAFWAIEDESLRDQLMQLYPNGCYVAYANDVFCESRNESMDDHWRICHAPIGEGQIREPIGGSLVQVQEIYNDLTNIQRDVVEFTLPVTFADSRVVDVRKFTKSRVRAGAMYAAKGTRDANISQAFYETKPGQISEYSIRMREEFGNQIPQFLCGLFPAAYGGDTGGNDTAHGIAIERDQAMGRIGIYWRILKKHFSECAPLVVKAFSEGRVDPMTVMVENESGNTTEQTVSPEDFKNAKVHAFPETDEDFPTTWPQRKATAMVLMQDPNIGPALMSLSNVDNFKKTMGIPDWNIKGEGAWRKAKADIDLICQGAAVPPVDPILDDIATELESYKFWAQSEVGQKMRLQNPQIYMMVQMRAALMQQILMPPMPPPGMPPEEGGPPAGPEGPKPPGKISPLGGGLNGPPIR